MLFTLKVEQNASLAKLKIQHILVNILRGSEVQAFMIDLVIYLNQITMHQLPVHLL